MIDYEGWKEDLLGHSAMGTVPLPRGHDRNWEGIRFYSEGHLMCQRQTVEKAERTALDHVAFDCPVGHLCSEKFVYNYPSLDPVS